MPTAPRTDTSPRDPERGPLHALLREHLETFLAERPQRYPEMTRVCSREVTQPGRPDRRGVRPVG